MKPCVVNEQWLQAAEISLRSVSLRIKTHCRKNNYFDLNKYGLIFISKLEYFITLHNIF